MTGRSERGGLAGRAEGIGFRERAGVGLGTGSALQCIMGGPFDGTGPRSCHPGK